MPLLSHWNPEDAEAWKQGGARVAWRNLLISIPALLCAFSVWMFWSVLTVRMKEAGFPFSDAQLFTLVSIAGLTGATLRIPGSFMVGICGGRNTIALSTGLLLLPALGAGLALRDPATPFGVFVFLSALCGIGGGNFATSMANVPPFWPKRRAGTALGLNGGLGNLGVSVMQLLTPLVMGCGLFGGIAGGALVWVPVLALLAAAAWIGMDNLPTQDAEPVLPALGRILGLHLVGFAASALGILLLVRFRLGIGGQVAVLALTVLAALGLLKALRGGIRSRLEAQFRIFRLPDTWWLGILYLGTFGSFIGFSGALPLLIKVLFGTLPGGQPNPHAPNPLAYAWIGAFVGSVTRPLGGWIADRWKGAALAQIALAVMGLGALALARIILLAKGAPDPGAYFPAFLGVFILLFVAAGLGNGAVFQMAPARVAPAFAGPVVGWISAVAAYGSFLVPSVFKVQVEAGRPQNAMYGFMAFYAICLIVNGWRYLGSRR